MRRFIATGLIAATTLGAGACAHEGPARVEERDSIVKGLNAAGYSGAGEVYRNHYNWGPDDFSVFLTIGKCVRLEVVFVPIDELWVPTTPELTTSGRHVTPVESPDEFMELYDC